MKVLSVPVAFFLFLTVIFLFLIINMLQTPRSIYSKSSRNDSVKKVVVHPETVHKKLYYRRNYLLHPKSSRVNDPLSRLRRGGLEKRENCRDICRMCKQRRYENCDGTYGCRCRDYK